MGLLNRDFLLIKNKVNLNFFGDFLHPLVGMLTQVNLTFPTKKTVMMTSLKEEFLSFVFQSSLPRAEFTDDRLAHACRRNK